MKTCDDLRKRLSALAACRPGEVPAGDRKHLAGCPTCARALAGARLARGLLAAAAQGPEPPTGFAEGVLAALPDIPVRGRVDLDLWRSSWALVPAFAATAGALLLLFQTSGAPAPVGLLPADGLSTSEQLLLDTRAQDPDLVLTAVLEGGGR